MKVNKFNKTNLTKKITNKNDNSKQITNNKKNSRS